MAEPSLWNNWAAVGGSVGVAGGTLLGWDIASSAASASASMAAVHTAGSGIVTASMFGGSLVAGGMLAVAAAVVGAIAICAVAGALIGGYLGKKSAERQLAASMERSPARPPRMPLLAPEIPVVETSPPSKSFLLDMQNRRAASQEAGKGL